jgi:uncharacterized coiled-coil DUF342 family protein
MEERLLKSILSELESINSNTYNIDELKGAIDSLTNKIEEVKESIESLGERLDDISNEIVNTRDSIPRNQSLEEIESELSEIKSYLRGINDNTMN